MTNQIMVIAPYWYEETATWVFDDPKVGLEQEPFISGVLMIDFLVQDIPHARNGFRLLFSPLRNRTKAVVKLPPNAENHPPFRFLQIIQNSRH